MIIRKLFKFENAHIVRKCTSTRCSESIHGHSYKVEVLTKSNFLDNGQMVYDFGLMKGYIKDLIDNISVGDNTKTVDMFNSTMKSRIMDAIETRKVELGNSVYNREPDNEDI